MAVTRMWKIPAGAINESLPFQFSMNPKDITRLFTSPFKSKSESLFHQRISVIKQKYKVTHTISVRIDRPEML